MDELTLLADLHKAGLRQGPGSPDVTRRAMVLAGLTVHARWKLRISAAAQAPPAWSWPGYWMPGSRPWTFCLPSWTSCGSVRRPKG